MEEGESTPRRSCPLNSILLFFHQPFQTVPVTGVSNLNQLKDAVDACDIDLAPELFGGWVTDGGNR